MTSWHFGARRWRAAVLVAILGSIALSCGADEASPANDELGGTVLVSAASSLTDAFRAMEAAFEASEPDIDVRMNLAGSAALREQILGGAPVDVFASANEKTMAELADSGAIADDAEVFASNALEIAVPSANPAGVTDLSDLADPDLLVGLCASGVPCGDLARVVLANAGVEASVDTDEPDVRSLLGKVAAAEVDVGLVYASDIAASTGEVTGIEIASDVNAVNRYQIGSLVDAVNPNAAAAFVRFVLSEDGQRILAENGFGKP